MNCGCKCLASQTSYFHPLQLIILLNLDETELASTDRLNAFHTQNCLFNGFLGTLCLCCVLIICCLAPLEAAFGCLFQLEIGPSGFSRVAIEMEIDVELCSRNFYSLFIINFIFGFKCLYFGF